VDERLASLTVPETAHLIDAVLAIKENRSRCALALAGERVVGVISEGDVMRALLSGADVHSPLANWLNYGFKFLKSKDYALALDMMQRHGITLVPVVGEAFELLDVVTLGDVLSRVRYVGA